MARRLGPCRRLWPGLLAGLWIIRLHAAGANDPTILSAVLQRDAAVVQQLLNAGADVNGARGDGLTALHAAALEGDLQIAQMLIVAGANITAGTALTGSTPLHLAARNGQAAVVELLLKSGANPDRRDTLGTTPLMLAAASGNAGAVTALLDAGADPNTKESVRDETALMFAAADGRTDAVAVLLRRGADWRPTTKVFDWTKLRKTDPRLASGDAHPVKSVQGAPGEATAPANDEKETESSRTIGAEADRRAAAAGAHVEARPPSYIEIVGTQGGLTALMFAARQGHLDAVQAFVEHGADVNQRDPGDSTTALLIAIINGRFDVAMYLVDHGANSNLAQKNGAGPLYALLNARWAPKSEYPNPLYYAAQRVDYLQLAKALLDSGADPNARLRTKVWYTNQNNDQSGLDETGATPFWRAAYADDIDAMKLLIAYGADPNVPTTYPGKIEEYPPTDEAKTEDASGLPATIVGGPNITPLLAASGEGYGWSFTASHHRFAPAGMLPAVKYLVEVLHADVNAPDAAGNTPLHNAASRGDNEMILYLVSRGANLNAINRKGQTVADMANGPMQRIQPFPQTVALLSKLGVQVRRPCVSC
jgi:ankyrin repeat protein